jgi:4-amino-4-deoxy-L-arabinose transferase-like glycosyltransferase
VAAAAQPVAPKRHWPAAALTTLLAVTAVLYLWDLPASGYANTFYAAAAQAGSQNWKAWFFGSLDAQNFITVDKPPAALWVMGLSVRIFGMSSFAVLAPQALMGVASVALVYFSVRRAVPDARHGAAAGLLAGAVLALTPAAALMFRFDNPDALLVFLMTAGGYCLLRAVHSASGRWLAVVGLVVGSAFITKMLQGFVVLPAFAATYLLLAPTGRLRRVAHLVGAGVAVVVAAGWWVLTVALWPADSRPYIGGSTNNSVLDLAFGYNGVGRIVGRQAPPAGDFTGSAFGGARGAHRLFSAEMGYEISWLLPVSLCAMVFGGYLAARGRLSRDERAAWVMWGGWLSVTALVFSFMGGVVHPYYTVALAPAVAALGGLGGVWAWRQRTGWDGRIGLAAMIVLAGGWSAVLLRHAGFGPAWTRWTIGGLAVAAAVGVLVLRRHALSAAVLTGMLAGLAGTAAFTVATVATPHHGGIPVAVNVAGVGVMRGLPWLGDDATESAVAELLATTHTTWSAATNGSQSAAALEIASGTSVMALGGWSDDPVPTLGQFIDDVHAGRISYYLAAGRVAPGAPHKVIGEPDRTSAHTRVIADWVAQNYPASTIGEMTIYRLR